jgi:hypothetical protein
MIRANNVVCSLIDSLIDHWAELMRRSHPAARARIPPCRPPQDRVIAAFLAERAFAD